MRCPEALVFRSLVGYCIYPTSFSSSSYDVDCTQRTTSLVPGPPPVIIPAVPPTIATFPRPDPPTVEKRFICASDGFFAYPSSCYHFYRCVGLTAYRFDCPPGLQFNPKLQQCDHPNEVNCV